MTIAAYRTAFTSYDVKANKQTKDDTSQEKVSFDTTVKKTNAVENVVYHTTIQADDAKPTTFRDPVTQKYVIASLKDETLDKLRGYFGTDNIIEKEDGTIRLTSNAEAFVSGWFTDIAYKREFLIADANNDGNLSNDGKISLDEVMVSFGGTLNTIPLEKLKSFDKENCELSIEDMDQVLSFMDYIRTLFLKLKIEAELIKVVDNSLLHNIMEPEQVNKILTKELFELLIKKSDKSDKSDKSRNKLENDDLPNIKKVENSSNSNIDKIKDTIAKL